MIGEFADDITQQVIKCAHEQLKRYYDGCNKDNTFTTAIENNISKRLIKNIENLLAQDMINGGSHEIKKPILRGEPVLMIDKAVAFSSWNAAGLTCAREKYSLHSDYDRIKEGNNLLQLIDDMETMSPYKFVEKWRIENYMKGTDMFAAQLLDNFFDPQEFAGNSLYLSEKTMMGTALLDDKAKVAVWQFLSSNPEAARCDFENGELCVFGTPIDRVGLNLKIRRSEISEPFDLQEFSLLLFTEGKEKEFFKNDGVRMEYSLKPSETGRKVLTEFLYNSNYAPRESEIMKEYERIQAIKKANAKKAGRD